MTKYSAYVATPEQLPTYLRQALRSAVSGTPGPVHLDLQGLAGYRHVGVWAGFKGVAFKGIWSYCRRGCWACRWWHIPGNSSACRQEVEALVLHDEVNNVAPGATAEAIVELLGDID